MLQYLLLLAVPLLGASGLLGEVDFTTSLLLFVLSAVAVTAEVLDSISRGKRKKRSLLRLLLTCIFLYAAQVTVMLYPHFEKAAKASGPVHHEPSMVLHEHAKAQAEPAPDRAGLPAAGPKGARGPAADPPPAAARKKEVPKATGERPSKATAITLPGHNFGGELHSMAKSYRSITVVLPCADERDNALNTVDRFCTRTPEDVLAQIIVVDDGSTPPMTELFAKDSRRLDQKERCKLKIVRHEVTTGLMAAKLTGGKVATGDVIAFIDCHCAPKKGWHTEIMDQMKENPRRMIVPAITDLDMDIFDEKKNSAVNAKCYLTFDCDFKWFDDESDFVPTISGGLVAMSREWFNLTGGFDEEMHGWGGENLDQSLRTWLCGGEITRAKSSRIAHMWRTGDRRTGSHYRVRAKPTNNRGRVAAAWFDAFLPVYRGSKVPADQVKNYDSVKQRLGCKPFVYFLYRFRKVYIEGGVIAKSVFHLTDTASGNCLARGGSGITVIPCAKDSHMQQFQLGNVDRHTGKCCSGLRAYRSNDCIDYFDGGGPHWYPCDVSGQNGNQQYRIREDGRIEKADGHCLYVAGKKVKKMPCDELKAEQGVFKKQFETVPEEMKLYTSELASHRIEEEFPDLPDS